MDDASDQAPKRSFFRSLMIRLRGCFFTGILVTAPISITFYIAWRFISFVDQQVRPLIPPEWNPGLWGMPGVGLVLVVVVLTVIGALMAGLPGQLWLRLSGAVIARMPILSSIYSTLKQLLETVLANKTQAFREVVLIEYPRRGLWTIAFVTGDTIREVAGAIDPEAEIVNVFVPTTPNPTSGFLLYLPRSDTKPLSLTVEEGLKLVISTGIVTPAAHLPVPVTPNAAS